MITLGDDAAMKILKMAADEVGGVGALARKVGVSQSAVSNWSARGRVPAERCVAIEKATDGNVTRHDLRPDIFGPPPHTKEGGHA